MPTSEQANLPRWKKQAGFFEIWFLCVLDPGGERAWWLRYTLFTPAPGAPGEPRATLWAAAFDCASPTEPAVAVKAIHPISAFDAGTPGRFGIRIGDAELAPGKCHGSVASGGHSIAWDLRYTPESGEAVRRTPRGIGMLPLVTHVNHSHDDIAFSGTVTVDGKPFEVRGAPGMQKHLWGHRRIEELTWLYCPIFREDPEARLEALTVRQRRGRGPRLTPIYLRTSKEKHTFHEVPGLLFTKMETPRPGELTFQATSATVSVKGRAWCDPRTLVGYAYRDPRGWDVHVAQSDVANCELEFFTRSHPYAAWKPDGRKLTSAVGALEFHGHERMEGVRYVGWDDTVLPAVAAPLKAAEGT
ncbi:MAG TPA: hypothetical protein VEU33_31845 [Archangium sp.]|nr:hypothetical protein [Archangium sp.]